MSTTRTEEWKGPGGETRNENQISGTCAGCCMYGVMQNGVEWTISSPCRNEGTPRVAECVRAPPPSDTASTPSLPRTGRRLGRCLSRARVRTSRRRVGRGDEAIEREELDECVFLPKDETADVQAERQGR